jgi:hypothetical protein
MKYSNVTKQSSNSDKNDHYLREIEIQSNVKIRKFEAK